MREDALEDKPDYTMRDELGPRIKAVAGSAVHMCCSLFD